MADIHEKHKTGHVVLIAPPLGGHMIPMLDLAKHLSAYCHVTYVMSASKLGFVKRLGFLVENEDKQLAPTHSGINFMCLDDHNDDDYEVSLIEFERSIRVERAILCRFQVPIELLT